MVDKRSGSGQADIAQGNRRWAQVEGHGSSPAYERLALAIAEDRGAIELLEQVDRSQRQPNLLFAALRWHGVDVHEPDVALAWIDQHPAAVLEVLRTRRTQTNEAARCALLLPALAALAARSPGPLALVEIGASAGLCLLYDSWRYRYTTDAEVHQVGDPHSPVTLACAVSGPAPLPQAVPSITWRAGLDLHPVDPADPEERRWLQCLVWPEHVERAERLSAALDLAADARAEVRAGDMTSDLAALIDEARTCAQALAPEAGPATVVVTHTAALAYINAEARSEVRAVIAAAGAHRLGAEGPGVLPDVHAALPAGTDVAGRFVVSLDDTPLALAHPHGAALDWLQAPITQ